MSRSVLLNVRRTMSRIESTYRENDLCSLIAQYCERAANDLGGRIKYREFYDEIKEKIIPELYTDPQKIKEALCNKSYTYDELSCFYGYAAWAAISELTLPVFSEVLLVSTVCFLKDLYTLDPSELLFLLSEAETVLEQSPYFHGSTEETKNVCRRNVALHSKKFKLSEAESARILCASDPVSKRPSFCRYLYFPSAFLLTFLLFLLFTLLLHGNIIIGLLLILPLSELSKQICDTLFSRLVRHTPIPRLKLDNIPSEGKTLCVITALLSSKKDADSLCLSIRNAFFSNSGDNICFGLLCDLPQSKNSIDDKDIELIGYTEKKIDKLNGEYGSNIFLFIRNRRYCKTEESFLGWERKRGAIIELTRLLKGEATALNIKCADSSLLKDTKYVITLDSDTKLYNGAVLDLVGAMLHPSNKPTVKDGIVVSGHAIMQPRMEICLRSAERTPFSVLSSGNGGTDIYASAAYETYQSVFDEGIFCGKGIFDVSTFSSLIDGAFSDGIILSHDLLEGARLRTGSLTDIALCDDLPKNPLSCFDRQHRWIRGDVQALAFVTRYIKNAKGELYKNPISTLSRLKLYDNIRRAAVPVFSFICILICIFLPEGMAELTMTGAISHLIFPCLLSVFLLIKRSGRRFFSYALPSFFGALGSFLYALASLPVNAIISADAILRSGFRMLFSGRNLLQWRTASQSEAGMHGLTLYIYRMLPSLLVGSAILILCPEYDLKLMGLLFAAFPFFAYLIGRDFKRKPRISDGEKKTVAGYAEDIWRFFSENVGESDNYLPPDNIQYSPVLRVAHRSSPTNIGLYLLSCAAAKDLSLISENELISRVRHSLDTVGRLQKYRGHLYNWYSTRSLDILGQPYISTVDSGNFCACLIALKYSLTDTLPESQRRQGLLDDIDKLIDECDFSFLYDEKKKLFRVGYNSAAESFDSGYYDLYMSEARIASYYAVASRQIGREHFSALGRPLIGKDGYIGLASWSGTMFEYFMPALVLPVYSGSVCYEALHFAIREQKRSKVRGIFGRSESGYYAFDADMNYQYKAFGVQMLGLKRNLGDELVISPYSSFLCIPFAATSMLRNLDELKKLGMYGKYGFYEAIDLTPSRVGQGNAIIRSYMSHHMGMSLIACTNALLDDIFVKRFMSCPKMASSAELLEEKIPINAPLYKRITKRNYSYTPLIQRSDISRIVKNDSPEGDSSRFSAVISENGLTVCGAGDTLHLSCSGTDISVDPFTFGRIHRPRLLFSCDGKIYDALKEGIKSGPFGGRISYRSRHGTISSEASVSLSGKHKAVSVSLLVHGGFEVITPLFIFEPALSAKNERLNHPAFCDIMISAEHLASEGILVFSKKLRESPDRELCIAVSFEGYGKGADFLSSREELGLQYNEDTLSSLFSREFEVKNGAVINPFCAVKKTSKTPSGRYLCNILISFGSSRAEVLSSIASVRKEASLKRNRNISEYLSHFVSKTARERLGVCHAKEGIDKYLSLMLPLCLKCKAIGSKEGKTFPVGELWKHGISGDIPIFCIDAPKDIFEDIPSQNILYGFISAHKYLAFCGIRSDLVIIYEDSGEYFDRVCQTVDRICELTSCSFMRGHKGGIFTVSEKSDAVICASSLYVKLDKSLTADAIRDKYTASTLREEPIITRQGALIAPKSNAEGYSVYGGRFTDEGFILYKGKQSRSRSYVYALSHFGTLLTQNSLGYTWIGNCRERRITPYDPDELLDFSGERIILYHGNKKYDLCACSDRVIFGKGGARYIGTAEDIEYEVRVTVDPYLPCKIIEISSDRLLDIEFSPSFLLSDLPSPYNSVCKKTDGDTELFFPAFAKNGQYDIGFLLKKSFGTSLCFILGAYPSGGDKTLYRIKERYSSYDAVSRAFSCYEKRIDELLPKERLICENEGLSVMVNYYLPYQALVCRLFGRTGFYQSGGAYGFRDQLQDCIAIMRGAPRLARRHIIRAAAHQYEQGDTMHWWHTVRGVSRGVRTRYSDDALWLPYVTSLYISFSGDRDILDIKIPYLCSEPLPSELKDRYETAKKGKFKEDLYCHCIRAIEKTLVFGKNGLPLMGGGDWNDGMNLVGKNGGQSVWLGFFLLTVLELFIPIAEQRGDHRGASKYRETVSKLKADLERCYDNGYYKRAYFSDGTPLCGDGFIDLLPQAFAAINGINKERARSALTLSEKILFDRENRILKLLSPPFDGSGEKRVGYIEAYPCGIRENGGQYTHGAIWAAIGASEVGMNRLAADILLTLNPADITKTAEGALRYGGEPYFVAGDVSSAAGNEGRCGWSLYTGAAGWYKTAVTDHLLGIKISSELFTVTPKLSSLFPEFEYELELFDTKYRIKARLGKENRWVLDGEIVNNLFYFDKKAHSLEITVENLSEMS